MSEAGGRAIGLGCMRLSTVRERDRAHSIAVIHAALDAGATLLDTADAYALDEADVGHNERLVAEALSSWAGDRSRVVVATKGGLRRPGGRWVPDGRARHLRSACAASRRALGVDAIDLYQLHVVDPRTPIETSVRALAALRDEGWIRSIGLCNVTVGQIEAARSITDIVSVQVGVGVLDDENLRNGVAEYCREHALRLIAYRPLGGERVRKIEGDDVLRDIGSRHGVTAQEIALAWLLDLDPCVVPIPGATRVETAQSLARVLTVELSDDDRSRLDARFRAGRILRVPRAQRQPSTAADGEVVLVMGMPAAGKSGVAQELVADGYARLNRDQRGGRLADLVAALDRGLGAGRRRWVLDNTYATRASRNEVIECAWRHGVPVRCIWLTTPIEEAQANAVERLLAIHGRLPRPEELRALGRTDPRFFGPDAQYRYARQLEAPVVEEGFTAVEPRAFTRTVRADASLRAVLLEFDGVLSVSARGDDVALDAEDVQIADERRDTLRRYADAGWLLLAIAWRPQIEAGTVTEAGVAACFEQTRTLLGADIDIAHCSHAAGPPVCWCRKPLPGLVLELAHRHGVALGDSLYVGRAAADRTLAARLGIPYLQAESFYQT